MAARVTPNTQIPKFVRTNICPDTHSQEPCEWFGHDLQVLLAKLDQILHLKVDCSDFGPVWFTL